MNKTTKGAFAASAAAVLLLGGAGSLAYWSDGDTVNGGSFTSGKLTLKASPDRATACDTVWKYDNGAKAGSTVVNVVPGDQITKTCRFVVGATGDHLSASPSVPATVAFTKSPKAGSTSTGATLQLPVTATYTLGGAAFTTDSVVTEADDTKTLAAKIVVTMPFGSTTVNGNDTQNLNVALADLSVSLTQTVNTANPN